MDFNFKFPTLELQSLIQKAKFFPNSKEQLRKYVVENNMLSTYNYLIKKNILQENKQDLRKIEEQQSNIMSELNLKKQKDFENATLIKSIDIQIAECQAQFMNVEESLELMRLLTRDESSLSLLMDIYLCKIRIGMLIKNKKLIEENFESATDVCDRGCDWDRRNKFKIYQAIYYLQKGDFKKTADFFSDSLPSFEKNEVVSYKNAVEYLIFSGMLSYERNDINKKLYTCPEVLEVGNPESLKLISNFYECDYFNFLPSLYIYIKKLEEDLYIKKFLNLFCKEMKIKIYNQLLKSYQMLNLKNMASVFGVSESYLEDDLGNFISKKRLNCKIDKVANTVVLNDEENTDMDDFVELGENLIRTISEKLN